MEEHIMKDMAKKGIIYFLAAMLLLSGLSKSIHGAVMPRVTLGSGGSGSVATQFLLEGSITLDSKALQSQQVSVNAELNGEIERLCVEEGQAVEKGECLMVIKQQQTLSQQEERRKAAIEMKNLQLDSSSCQQQIAANKEQLYDEQKAYEALIQESAEKKEKTELLEKRQEIAQLKKKISLNEQLLSAGGISQSDVEETKNQYTLAQQALVDLIAADEKEKKEKLKASKEKIEALQNAISELQNKLLVNSNNEKLYIESEDQTQQIVKSPISGKVYKLEKHVGVSAAAGEELLILVPHTVPYVLTFEMNRRQADKMNIGDPVPYLCGRQKGTAVLKERSYDEGSQSYRMACELAKEEADNMTKEKLDSYKARVEITFTSQSYEMVVPVSAIVKENNEDYIYTAEEEEGIWGKRYKASAQKVQVLEEGDTTAAVDASLSGSSQIIISRSKSLCDGDEVVVTK